MRPSRSQRKRLLERMASLLHEDIHTEGFQEQCEVIGLDLDAGAKWLQQERDAILRRAARLGDGEAKTRIMPAPVESP